MGLGKVIHDGGYVTYQKGLTGGGHGLMMDMTLWREGRGHDHEGG